MWMESFWVNEAELGDSKSEGGPRLGREQARVETWCGCLVNGIYPYRKSSVPALVRLDIMTWSQGTMTER